MLTFKAYATTKFSEADAAYSRQFGERPSALVICPDFLGSEEDDERVVRTRFGSAGLIFATHILHPHELAEFYSLSEANRTAAGRESLAESDRITASLEVPKHEPGRPSHGGGMCPMCSHKVEDFDALGWWWGWDNGIEPPYWEQLRLYVFRRDEYRCSACGKKYPLAFLVAHHIVPKETGGPDSGRNLTTMCQTCHPDDKPIMPTEAG